MKQYVTYKRKKINDHFFADPNTNNGVERETGGVIKLYETPYEVDGVFIAYIEYDENIVNVQQIEYFKNLDPAFEFTIIDESTVNILLSQIWDIIVQDFVFTDNRPVEF